MSARPQLKLVMEMPPRIQGSADPVARVFDHWVAMNGKMPARTKLGPSRRKAIGAWMTIYGEDMLCAAVEGMAADALEDCNAGQRAAMRELEWLLGSEARIERWAEAGFSLRDEMAQADVAPTVQADEPADSAQVAAARERLARFVAERRGGR